jgi:hypothetical protein
MRGQFLSALVGGVVGGCVILALQGSLAKAQGISASDTLAVRELVVVDSKGKVRISLRCDTNDAPRMRMMDANGAMRCVMGLGNPTRSENPFFYLVDQTGVKANLSIAEDGAPVFFLNGRDGKPRVFMCSSPSGKGEVSQLVVYGNNKGIRTEIISAAGKTGISSYKHGAMRTYTGIMPEGMAGLMANDDDGRPGTVIGITSDDRRVLTKLKKGEHIDLNPTTPSKSPKDDLKKQDKDQAKRQSTEASSTSLTDPTATATPSTTTAPAKAQ